MSYESELKDADAFRHSDEGRIINKTAALIPGTNILSEGADAFLDGQLAEVAAGHGDYVSALQHELAAGEHAGMAALNFLTLGEAGPGLHAAGEVVEAVHATELVAELSNGSDLSDGIAGHSIAGAASSHMRTRSLGDAARKGFDYGAINAIPAGGGS